jgi:lipoprotein NlpI
MSAPFVLAALVASFLPAAATEDTLQDVLAAGRVALQQRQPEKALAAADKAITMDAKSSEAHFLRGLAHDALRRHADAVKDFNRVIELDPKAAVAYNYRGMAHFKLAHIAEAITDFDAFLQLQPDQTPRHWQRGIAYYYAGRFDEGRRQFEGYQRVDNNDVENAVWRYLCMARAVGVEQARKDLMKVGRDRRVPMMVVYELFAGRAKPDDVLAAVDEGKPVAEERKLRQFYADLYLGLYYEAIGDKKAAREYLTKAAGEPPSPNFYMWDVARVHVELLNKADKP